MEKYLLIALFILLVSLIISFILFITDYSEFKKRIEIILDLNIEVNDNAKEVINITEKVNNSVGEVCKLNNRLIANINLLLTKNAYLEDELKDKENNEK